MANYDDHYQRDEKTKKGGNSLKKTLLTLAAGGVLALGGKAVYDNQQAESDKNDKKDPKQEVVAETKTDSVISDDTYVAGSDDFVEDNGSGNVIINSGDIINFNGKTYTNSSTKSNKESKTSTSIKVGGISVKSSKGETTVSKDGDTMVINGNGGNISIINGQIFIDGKPLDMGKDR